MAEAGPVRTGRRRAGLVLLGVLASAVLAAALIGCDGSSPSASASASTDPLVGYWIGGGQGSQMTLVQIAKDGGAYSVLANPDLPAGDAVKDGRSLVVDTPAFTMDFTPQPDDRLRLKFTGELFRTPVATTLTRTDKTGYAGAATAYGLVAIRRGLAMWKAGGGKAYPPPNEVTPSGTLAQMIRWPTNLFSGEPMQPGQDEGDYTYARLNGGQKYSLVAHLSDGSTLGK